MNTCCALKKAKSAESDSHQASNREEGGKCSRNQDALQDSAAPNQNNVPKKKCSMRSAAVVKGILDDVFEQVFQTVQEKKGLTQPGHHAQPPNHQGNEDAHHVERSTSELSVSSSSTHVKASCCHQKEAASHLDKQASLSQFDNQASPSQFDKEAPASHLDEKGGCCSTSLWTQAMGTVRGWLGMGGDCCQAVAPSEASIVASRVVASFSKRDDHLTLQPLTDSKANDNLVALYHMMEQMPKLFIEYADALVRASPLHIALVVILLLGVLTMSLNWEALGLPDPTLESLSGGVSLHAAHRALPPASNF